jgi:hypothetical protein
MTAHRRTEITVETDRVLIIRGAVWLGPGVRNAAAKWRW